MDLINSGVQHIDLDGAPDVVKGDPVWFIVALGIPALVQAVGKDFLNPPLVPMGSPLSVKTKSWWIDPATENFIEVFQNRLNPPKGSQFLDGFLFKIPICQFQIANR